MLGGYAMICYACYRGVMIEEDKDFPIHHPTWNKTSPV